MVGERLTELRIKNNMTQEEFAEYMCVTRQSVSKWETDKTYPDVEKLIKIAELYNVTLDYLVRGQEVIEETVQTKSQEEIKSDELNDNESSLKLTEDEEIIKEQSKLKKSEKNKISLKICLGIAVMFIILAITMISTFLIQNPWFHSDIVEKSARVEKVYGQLSLAQVSYENEDGEILTELVVLDIANVREGDYINAFADADGELFFDYGTGIILITIVFLLLNITVVILLTKEMRKL